MAVVPFGRVSHLNGHDWPGECSKYGNYKQTHKLAGQLAKLTGENMTEAVTPRDRVLLCGRTCCFHQSG
jgi:hypothetical protein